ncbi:hypothetical protein TrCOL_g9869 [Triparma columacea]|uniref:Transmembrane protein 45B n=1 Tax=Triparma columacea TaxID=722753 RepID=A0A9W7GKS5_9STRA|nr:hypothetical protein TrCOL_g9869 [Triparma columacea]
MGDFRGHFVPGSFFLLFSIAYMSVILHRTVRGSLRHHIPEKNERVLRAGAYFVIIATFIGFCMEMIGGILYSTGPFHQILHECLYLSYFIVAITALLESHSRLPLDTWRTALAVALLLEGILFNAHANMQEGYEKIEHQLMSLCSISNGLVALYSVRNPKDIFAYVTTFGLMAVQGLWFYVIAFTYKGLVLTMHTVTPAFAIVCMGVWAVATVASAWGRDKDTESSLERQEYKKVRSDVEISSRGGEDGII